MLFFRSYCYEKKEQNKIEVLIEKYIACIPLLAFFLFYFDYVLCLLLPSIMVDKFMCFPNMLIDSHLTMLAFQSSREMKNFRER